MFFLLTKAYVMVNFSISQNKLTDLLKHYKEHSLTSCVKKSGCRQRGDQRLHTHDNICRVVSFIVNFAELHALILPGRMPGYKRFDMKLLASHYTKTTVSCAYERVIKEKGRCLITKHLCPVIMHIRLCHNTYASKPILNKHS